MNLIKQNWNSRYRWDIITIIAIVSIPFSIYFHLLFDQGQSEFVDFFGVRFYHTFWDNGSFVWFFFSKIIPLTLCIFWFLTCEYWWRYFILSPMGWYTFLLVKKIYYRFDSGFDANFNSIIATLILILSILTVEWLLIRGNSLRRIKPSINQSFNSKNLYALLTFHLSKLKSNRNLIDDQEYSYRLFYLEKLINTNKKAEGDSRSMDYFFGRIRFIDFVIILFLILYPFFYSLYRLAPVGEQETYLFGFHLDSNGFVDMNTFIWFLLTKLSLTALMIIWFYTARNWWRYAILSPIILNTYQFWEANQDVQHLDAWGNLKAFPAVFSVVFLLVVLSRTFKYKYGLLDIHDSIVEELDTIISKEAESSIRDSSEYRQFEGIKADEPDKTNSKNHLQELYRIKDKIEYRLKTLN